MCCLELSWEMHLLRWEERIKKERRGRMGEKDKEREKEIGMVKKWVKEW